MVSFGEAISQSFCKNARYHMSYALLSISFYTTQRALKRKNPYLLLIKSEPFFHNILEETFQK